ncbi:hypothetical protein [Spiroplasma sp. SV19]|uniref:hypothetical protein n=1 Tax=Spiroplasma sp. SV19 TaxID=2570468 RepID=UPI0024B7397B|nr:hypothetical protein [Spiroplasma sp. SV19]WHQ36585.1 hypothetical protein E7Y35_01410 [Spiroplasma sp. SV19]
MLTAASASAGASSIANIINKNQNELVKTSNLKLNYYDFDENSNDSYYFGGTNQGTLTEFNRTNSSINGVWGSQHFYNSKLQTQHWDMSDAPVSDNFKNYNEITIFNNEWHLGLAQATSRIALQYYKGYDGTYNFRFAAFNSKTDWSATYPHFWGTV